MLRRHQWFTTTCDVAHRDLWEPFMDLVQADSYTF